MKLYLFIACFLACASPVSAQPGIVHLRDSKQIILADGQTNLVLRLNYANGCALDQVIVRGREVSASVFSSVTTSNQCFSTRDSLSVPKVIIDNNRVTVKNISFGNDGLRLNETWQFTLQSDRILWRIERDSAEGVWSPGFSRPGARKHDDPGMLNTLDKTAPHRLKPGLQTSDDMAMPVWNFNDMSTWTGGILGNGGVVWNKYLETTNATFGTHADSVTFWNRSYHDGLRIAAAHSSSSRIAAKFSHQPGGAFSFNCVVSDKELEPKHNLRRFLPDRQDLWKPFPIARHTSLELTLQALDYDKEYSLGALQGLNEGSVREVLNTIGRYGVIDKGLVGGNGWRTGWVCLHEPWFAQFGLALGDPAYTKTFAEALDYERDHAVQPDGRVKARWHHLSNDAQPGTYDPLGFYEAQWGMLLDSQPCYVINVAEQFDLTGDQKWLRGQKAACERALDYLLRRDSDADGLVEVMTDSQNQQRASDWIDVMWASYENALINAELYHALELWADAEALLGDSQHAASYRQFAAKLKKSFNRTTADGGFWDPKNQWYVYWRDKDDSIHGNNLVTPVNFAAVAYGLCEDPIRQKAILDRMETEMQKERLFFWPLNFFSYERGEGRVNQNFPFPSYENGDIFLPWGELGIRSYASQNPELALRYIKNVLCRYEADGLSFQRYLRQSQKGEGRDILAGNCSAVVGLYRDIYGLQPRHNRLCLEPHLTAELSGTRIRYCLRDQHYLVELATNHYRVSAGDFALQARTPFGVNIAAPNIEFFPGNAALCHLRVTSRSAIEIHIESWPTNGQDPRRWTESSVSKGKSRHVISGLQPGGRYELITQDNPPRILRANRSGRVQFSAVPQKFELRLLTGSESRL